MTEPASPAKMAINALNSGANFWLAAGGGPHYYLPKLKSHLEARLRNEIFVFAQHALSIPHGSIRATVLIETIPAAFEMDKILYELRGHASGLHAGRWDHLFSIIQYFRYAGPTSTLPDRVNIAMTASFMHAYTELLVKSCHRRGAFAMGGMAAVISNRREPEVTQQAFDKVRADKTREANDGFDGSWVAHSDLVSICREVFDSVLGDRPNQIDRQGGDVTVSAAELLDVTSARAASPKPGSGRTAMWPCLTWPCGCLETARLARMPSRVSMSLRADS